MHPQLNIKWGVGCQELADNILNYMKACLTDIETVKLEEQREELTAEDLHMDQKWFDGFRKYYRLSQPSLVLNNLQDQVSSFDILNHRLQTDVLSGYDKTQINSTLIM